MWRLIGCFLGLLWGGATLWGQELHWWNWARELDSLMYYSEFERGQVRAQALMEQLEASHGQGEAYVDFRLRVMLQQAGFYIRRARRSEAAQVALAVIDEAQRHDLPDKEFRACLVAAELYEQAGLWDLCKTHLDRAYVLRTRHGIDSFYSVYCIRASSYQRFRGTQDSALSLAKEGLRYAERYGNYREHVDAYLLLAILYRSKDRELSIKYALLAAGTFIARRDYQGAAAMYNIVTNAYIENQQYDKAKMYSDSAMDISNLSREKEEGYTYVLKSRSRLYEQSGDLDSALFYFKRYHASDREDVERTEVKQIKNIAERYENDKKTAEISSKNQQILFVGLLLLVIALAAIFLVISNRKIRAQNLIISAQVEELTRSVAQKQVLLSELQHRVKNNLQHVISILEIQKESVSFSTIEELIRSNQNRIHSMALLHKRLNIAQSVQEVELGRYLNELAELVRSSYAELARGVEVAVVCGIATMSIEKALPIGLIVVELVSNSIKYAFPAASGRIVIALNEDAATGSKTLEYSDNGIGFDMNAATDKGLGMEIVRGLIEQLDAAIVPDNQPSAGGFRLKLCFS